MPLSSIQARARPGLETVYNILRAVVERYRQDEEPTVTQIFDATALTSGPYKFALSELSS
jgi:hypothetical protein